MGTLRHKSLIAMIFTLFWVSPLTAGEVRDYYATLTPKDEANIRYLIDTMAEHSPISLWLFYRQSLEKAGRQTIHIHPLTFLKFVRTDPKLRYQVRRIKRAPWNRFQKYFVRSFQAAQKRHNLSTEVLEDFSQKTGISEKMLAQHIEGENWSALIDSIR